MNFDTKYLLVGVGNGFVKGLGLRKINNLWHIMWLIFYLQIYYLLRFFYLDKNRREWEESNSLYFFHNSQMGISLLLLDCLCNFSCSLSRHITVMNSFFLGFFLNKFNGNHLKPKAESKGPFWRSVCITAEFVLDKWSQDFSWGWGLLGIERKD